MTAAAEIARLSHQVSPMLETAAVDMSRVEQFKRAEAAAAEAPQIPVPRVVVAHIAPHVPVQVMAVRLDQAESLKITPLKLKPVKVKRKVAGRPAKLAGRGKKPEKGFALAGGKLPPSVVAAAIQATEPNAIKRGKKRIADAETSRDITNRSLGVLVALKN
jgi:hypothetical protein